MPDPGPPPKELVSIVERVLAEDLGDGDVTTRALVEGNVYARAEVRFREPGIVAGGPVAELALRELDVQSRFEQLVPEGGWAEAGTTVIRAMARAGAVLSSERVVLNFVAHLSGIATVTRHFVQAVKGLPVEIYATRKTTPGLRALEKYAVRAGGGVRHRMGLYDGILIKDNHLALLGMTPAGAAARAKSRANREVEVEVTSLEDALAASRAGADIVLLDNFSPEGAAAAIARIREEVPPGGRPAPRIEVSGGVTLDNVRAYAEAGPDRISVGALTHSAASLDVTLDLSPVEAPE